MITSSKVEDIIINEMAAKELRMATFNYNESQKNLREAEFKCDKLRQFRQDYIDRFNTEMQEMVSDDAKRGFKSFFARLDVVIFEQLEMVENLRREVKIQRQLLQESQRKVADLQKREAQAETSQHKTKEYALAG
jgi:flagellar biosynthesis chaperone FliJ